MKNNSSFTISDIQHDPLLFAKLLKRALAGNPTVIEDQKSGGRVMLVSIPEPSQNDPWGEPPPDVVEAWDKDVAAFEAAERKHPRPPFTSGAEFVEYMRQKS